MNIKTIIVIGLLALAALVVANSLYIVEERERAVLLEFGRMADTDVPPGLHWKWPMINQVRKFDARILTSRPEEQRFLTVEQKGMIVDYFVKWRILDVEKYYTATNGNELAADQAIARPVNEGLRNEFGERTLQEVVSGERDELMAAMISTVSQEAQDRLGVEIVDVRVKRIDLPEEVSSSVFSRMRAEREQEAAEHRARGQEQAEVIRAAADRERTVIKAEAFREAEMIRGEGDAKAAAIYAEAYGKNAEFYAFMRSLEAYRQSFDSPSDVLLVDPSSDFFRYLDNRQGGE